MLPLLTTTAYGIGDRGQAPDPHPQPVMCDWYFDVVFDQQAAAGQHPVLIEDPILVAEFLTDLHAKTGWTIPPTTRVFTVESADHIVIGLEQNGCLGPAQKLALPT
jgi:hypothetical protein